MAEDVAAELKTINQIDLWHEAGWLLFPEGRGGFVRGMKLTFGNLKELCRTQTTDVFGEALSVCHKVELDYDRYSSGDVSVSIHVAVARD